MHTATLSAPNPAAGHHRPTPPLETPGHLQASLGQSLVFLEEGDSYDQCGSTVDCHRDRGSGCSRLGYGISPLGGGHHLPHHRAARTYTGLGNRLSEGTTEPCAPEPRRKEQSPTGDCPGLTCRCPGVSGGGVGQWWPAAGLEVLSVAVHAWDLLREVTIILIQFSSVLFSHSVLSDSLPPP